MNHYAPYDPKTASRKDRIAWALCQIIDDDAPMRWTRYRFAADCIVSNKELMADLLAAAPPPAAPVSSIDYWQKRGHQVCPECNGSKVRSYRQADHLGGGYVDVPCHCASAGVVPSVSRDVLDLTLTSDEADTLRQCIGDVEAQSIRLQIGDGHSGHGLYVSSAEYPDEGSTLVCEVKP